MYLQMVQPDFWSPLEPFPVISASFKMETPLVQQCEKDGQEDVQYDTISIMTIVYSRTT